MQMPRSAQRGAVGPAGNSRPGPPGRPLARLIVAGVLVTLTPIALSSLGEPSGTQALFTSFAPTQTSTIQVGMWAPDPPAECGPLTDYPGGVVYGTEGDDVLDAGNRGQIVMGLGGDDKIYGGNAKDCLVGGDGNDVIYGGNGKDILIGGAGDDQLYGDNGKDTIYDDDPTDHTDTLIGGAGNDQLYGDNGKDAIYGNDGNDHLDGGNGTNDGNDTCNGGRGKNTIVSCAAPAMVDLSFATEPAATPGTQLSEPADEPSAPTGHSTTETPDAQPVPDPDPAPSPTPLKDPAAATAHGGTAAQSSESPAQPPTTSQSAPPSAPVDTTATPADGSSAP